MQLERYRPATYDEYLASQLTQDAILMRLQQIGENLIKIRRIDPDGFSELAPESWHKLIGLRNVIPHGYEEIESEQIWTVLHEGLGEFEATLNAIDLETGLPLVES